MRRLDQTASAVAVACVLACAGCWQGDGAGGDGEDGGDGDGTDGGEAPEDGGVGISGMRRLSRNEYDNTIRDLLLDDSRPASTLLPEDVTDPFDNDFITQHPSQPLVDGVETLASDLAASLVADAPRRDQVIGCTPSGADDAECMEQFIRSFGRRALRRPVPDDDVQTYVDLAMTYAADQDDFYQGVEVVLRVLLQHPRFVYRVELGAPTSEEGVFRLDDYEVATRLSYFVWGTTPDDELLDDADAGMLGTSEDVRTIAERLLADPRARDRVDRFHALWLGYYELPHAPDMTTAMRKETRSLIEQVVFDEQQPWIDLLTATGTFVNDLLADHYGMPAPGSDDPVWVEYPDDRRRGLLSHGAFLSVAGKFGDTSPTQRGKLIRTRLFCQAIPPPPPDVDVDDPPTSPDSECKYDRYASHRALGTSCNSCHSLMDPVGFGLENFDQTGAWRDHDNGLPECTISGDGDLDGEAFNGAAGLADMVVAGDVLDECVVTQVYRFAMGHREDDEDDRYLTDLTAKFRDGYRFDELMLALAADEAFLFRREEG